MIRDLSQLQATEAISCDVLVIGAGTAGLVIAKRLSDRGKRVLILESGAEHQASPTHTLNEVEQLGTLYAGAAHGRFRCLGGTSTRWGGAMLPFLPWDIKRSDSGWAHAGWPIGLEDFTAYLKQVEALFDLPEGGYEFPDLMKPLGNAPPDFIPRLAKWPPFKQRNVANLLSKYIRSSEVDIWLNATATRFELNDAGRLTAIMAEAPNGQTLRVIPQDIVLSAGAIESTRLLLLMDKQYNGRLFAADDVLGRYFHDHIAAPTARFKVKNISKLNQLTGFQFIGNAMRNLRFEPGEDIRRQHALPAGFAYIGFSTETPTGFDHLRDILRNLQKREPPELTNLAGLTLSAPWLMRALWWRLANRRLLFPDGAQFELHMVSEQEPLWRNRIGLSNSRVDMFGAPLATIDWQVSERDFNNNVALTRHFIKSWRGSHLSKLADTEEMAGADIRNGLKEGGGFYHPGGTIKMGKSARDGVVDQNLQCFKVLNLSVLSTAVFPTGGGANPTMTLLMAALRLGDHLLDKTILP